jgi:serine/threonine-protein kinase
MSLRPQKAAGYAEADTETLAGSPRPRPAQKADVSAFSGSQPLLLGRYVVHGIVGVGAMGRVYRATDSQTGKLVAIKKIKARFSRDRAVMARFVREAEAVSRLSHRNLVAIVAQGDDYVVMELVDGESLEARLAREERLEPEAAVGILADVAHALDYIHAQGIVHRDVKPSNLLLPERGGVKITDFGIAHLSWAPMTRSGELIGTPAFMAPEQIRGNDVSPATDVYALGLVAFEMLTGTRPFRGRTYAELLMRVIDASPLSAHELRPSLPPRVDEVFARALAKDPQARHTTAAAFVAALRVALELDRFRISRAVRRLLRRLWALLVRRGGHEPGVGRS